MNYKEKITIENIVRGICIREEKLLLAYSKKQKHYFLPGGHIEADENPIDALKRELYEEFNGIVDSYQFITEIENSFEQNSRTYREKNYLYKIFLKDTSNIKSKESHLDFVWIDINKLQTIRFLPKKLITLVEEELNK